MRSWQAERVEAISHVVLVGTSSFLERSPWPFNAVLRKCLWCRASCLLVSPQSRYLGSPQSWTTLTKNHIIAAPYVHEMSGHHRRIELRHGTCVRVANVSKKNPKNAVQHEYAIVWRG